MGDNKKFDPRKIDKLTNPARKSFQDPEKIWAALPPGEHLTLIDIGAGAGFFAVPFSQKEQVRQVYACDSSEVMVAWMAEHFSSAIREKVTVIHSSENQVPVQDGIADLVYMINLHHELDSPAHMLQECRRLLKSGGTLMIIDWEKREMEKGPPERIRIAREEVEQQIAAAGFGTITCHDLLPYHYMVTANR